MPAPVVPVDPRLLEWALEKLRREQRGGDRAPAPLELELDLPMPEESRDVTDEPSR